ncbi:nicotinate-nucleotide adenylyltransferase [Marinobacter sp. CHS3-4]|uniref:nicotinate-nucleotide adenylyltransferase n=1 Tax=Marinobacter sp. CHS3-4 TaxID=3045174 RepID=UPI0024B5A80C|nr:nicotinate-nucleotide adenylyltransferase [Marinobacter sp. CHS3-4]MDI9246229.1 nicotinate-nucleotide adenylyltransferase [Marinobacter sp. CHS3-4]
MKVIYGGTFDPIHHGHLRLAIELKECLGTAEIALVPCHIPPHRQSPGAGSDQRLDLLQLAVSDEPGLVVDERELEREGASYTADTLRQIRSEIGQDKPLAMVVGTDSFASFDRWREWEAIPQLAHIIVVVRPGSDIPAGSAAADLMRQKAATTVEELYAAPCGRVLVLEPPLMDISATGIRERIADGRSPRYLLPDTVWLKIRHLGLYRP